MMGYDEEDKTTVLELTYNYGVTEYTKGTAYAQVNFFDISSVCGKQKIPLSWLMLFL